MKTKTILLSVCFLSVASYSVKAGCITASIDCGGGKGSYALVCGETLSEMGDNAMEMADVVCN